MLIENGAEVNIAGRNGNTALITASNFGFEQSVRMLLEKGANINVTNHEGNSALMLAASSGQ